MAGVLTLVDNPDAAEIDAEHFVAAVAVIQFYLSEWQRLHDAGATDPDILFAEGGLREWLQHRWGGPVVGLADVYQNGPTFVREARIARTLMRLLEEHGWIVAIEEGAVVQGNRRDEAWTIWGK